MSCRVDGCEAEMVKHQTGHGYCATHYKRLKRGGDLAAPVQERLSPRQRAVEAAIGLADADSEDDGAAEKAEANFAAAVSRWRDPLVMRELAVKNAPLGGAARAKKLSAERRQEIATIAAIARTRKLTQEQRSKLARLAAQARWKHRNACLPGQASMRKPPREAGNGATTPQPPVKR